MRVHHAILFASLLSAAASAAERAPATDFDGTYDLRCTEVGLALNASLSVTTPAGQFTWVPPVSQGILPCAIPPRRLVAWATGIGQQCRAEGLPADACRDFAINLYQAVRPFSTVGQTLLPRTAVLRVDPASAFAPWGLYYATIGATYASGSASSFGVTLDNNVGTEGNFASLGAAVQVDGVDTAACGVLATAALQGTIDRDAGFGVSADYGVTAQYFCLGTVADALWTANLGLTVTAGLEGQRR